MYCQYRPEKKCLSHSADRSDAVFHDVAMASEEETRWAWLKPGRSKARVVRSGWLTKEQFRARFGPKMWRERWDASPRDAMPGKTEFQAFYGNDDWQAHWDWHHASESESEEPEEPGEPSALSSAASGSGTLGKSSSAGCEPRAKRKRKPNMVWSPPVEVKKKRVKKDKKQHNSNSGSLKTKTRKLTDGFLPYRTRFTKHTNTIVFYEQYLLAHTSDNRSSGDGRRVQDSRGIELARAHVAWAKHSLRGTLLELVETVNPGYVSLPDEAFDEDGIDAELIECCACSQSHCTDTNDILLCDGPCRRAYHMQCLKPPVVPEDIDSNLESDWYCWQCDAVLDCLDLLNERVESVSYEDVPRYDQMRAWFFAKEVSVLGGLRQMWWRHGKTRARWRRCFWGSTCSGRCAQPQRELMEGRIRSFGSRRQRETRRNHSCEGEPQRWRRGTRHADFSFCVFLSANGRSVETSRSLCRRRNQDMTVPEIENHCRIQAPEVQPSLAEAGKQGPSNLSSNSILGIDLKEDDDDGGEYVLEKEEGDSDSEAESGSSSDSSEEDEQVEEGQGRGVDNSTEGGDSEDGEEEEEVEDSGTRWGWVPHEGGGESGWMTEAQFKEHYGEAEWQTHWDAGAKWKKMPPKEAFMEYYRARRWKQHWDWQHNDEDEILATSRAGARLQNRNYEQMLREMQEDENEEGAWDDQLDWDDVADPDFKDSGKPVDEDRDGDQDEDYDGEEEG